MHNLKLIEYVRERKDKFEQEEHPDFKTLNYLYFADKASHLSIHSIQNSNQLNHSQIQKNIDDIESFQPHFDQTLAKKVITSLTICQFPTSLEKYRASIHVKNKFLDEVEVIQDSHGILRALLFIREWAFFPDNAARSKNHSRLAQIYLGVVLNFLQCQFPEDNEFIAFINWCGKRTRKVFPWGFKQKDLRSPPISSLPIYVDEAASYIRYFFAQATDSISSTQHQYAEMAIFLSLCLACARKHSNFFSPRDILPVTHNAIGDRLENKYITNDIEIRETVKSLRKEDGHAVVCLECHQNIY